MPGVIVWVILMFFVDVLFLIYRVIVYFKFIRYLVYVNISYSSFGINSDSNRDLCNGLDIRLLTHSSLYGPSIQAPSLG